MADQSTTDRNPLSPYWRSVAERRRGEHLPDVGGEEFAPGVTDDFDLRELHPISRKRFLALLSASAAFAAVGCTNYRDKGEIVPYTRKPEEITPGVANFYASTCTGCRQRCGILVKTREGRPVKIDGNADHPVNRGKTCAKGQASILNLYDPNRLRKPSRGKEVAGFGDLSWQEADRIVVEHLGECAKTGREVAIVAHQSFSPTVQAVFDAFRAVYPSTRIYTYDLFSERNRTTAWERCYGGKRVPVVSWEDADVVVALEADLLGTDGDSIEFIRKFSDRRDVVSGATFNRLYAVEGGMSLTGANADYRFRLRPDAQYEFLLAIIREIGLVRRHIPVPAPLAGRLAHVDLEQFCRKHGLPFGNVEGMIADLIGCKGKGMVYAGPLLPDHVHTLVHYLNDALGCTALYRGGYLAETVHTAEEELQSLVKRMHDGSVGMVVHVDTNPVFHLPPSLGYAAALGTVPVSVSLVEEANETSDLCTYVLPANHMLESWGDHQSRGGVLSLQQPVISPLFDSRQKEAVLLAWASPDKGYSDTIFHDFLMARWDREVFPGSGSDFRSLWLAALHDGAIGQAEGKADLRFDPVALQALPEVDRPEGFVVGLAESLAIGDGQFANNGWLQELPHPVSKVVWDNYAAISSATAAALGLENGDLVDVTLPHGRASLPVFIQPGQADRYLSVSLGYGRWAAGPIGSGVGTNAQGLLAAESFGRTRVFSGAGVVRGTGRLTLVSTQEQHSLSDGILKDLHRSRGIVREGTVEQYRNHPESLHQELGERSSISTEVRYPGLKWAMAIDLNRCIGCNACVAGCTVENNVPVVGKEQVEKGRAMHWIRLDRYYSGSEESPILSHQPMLCQHCDHAPCENVCPVSATTHSPDGLNQMVYNRCVGTKYCSNNCPYKVRRFNFYNFRDHLADAYYLQEPISLLHNPEVTVRSRGVMEKCTFCIQRIAEARQRATQEGRSLRGSDVRTACQEVCPAQAIVFGDMNDAQSEVNRFRTHPLGYTVLEEVNTRPNITYITRLRNTQSEKSS